MLDSPLLSPEIIRLVNDLCFGQELFEAGSFDAVLIFGTKYAVNQRQIADTFPAIFTLHKPKVVYITGGETEKGSVESEGILQFIDPSRYSQVEFRLDRTSTNTKENVEQAMMLGLTEHPRLLFVAKSPHRGRCRLTLAKYLLPSVKIQSRGYDPIFAEGMPPVRRDNWYAFPEVCRRMWGEFLRIEEYGRRGHIHYPPEVQEKVELIHRLVNARK